MNEVKLSDVIILQSETINAYKQTAKTIQVLEVVLQRQMKMDQMLDSLIERCSKIEEILKKNTSGIIQISEKN